LVNYRISELSSRDSYVALDPQTIHSRWAFHHGGRSELQFNIGLETISQLNQLRHGVAFSFELSQALPDIDVLIPKVRLFNDYLLLYPELYADMRMWHHRQHVRSSDYSPGPILPELVDSRSISQKSQPAPPAEATPGVENSLSFYTVWSIEEGMIIVVWDGEPDENVYVRDDRRLEKITSPP
jgi:hypothetical protein